MMVTDVFLRGVDLKCGTIGVTEELQDGQPPHGRVVRVVVRHEVTGPTVVDQLAELGEIAGDHGRPCGHGLQNDVRHPFPLGGEDQNVRGLEQTWNIRALTQEVNEASKRLAFRHVRLEFFAKWSFTG
jgi:hypothetical protein